MTKKSTPKKYSGALATRLEYHGRSEVFSDLIMEYCALPSAFHKGFEHLVGDALKGALFDYREQRSAKLPSLFQHYGISMKSPDCWRKLACSLAIAHVEGFKIEKPKGRKVVRPRFDFELWASVRLEQINGPHTITRACELIWKRNGKRGAPGDLRRRFTAANKNFGAHYDNLPASWLHRDLVTFRSRRKLRGIIKTKRMSENSF